MFSNAKVGDRVFDYTLQKWGVVTSIKSNYTYCLIVQFGDDEEVSYTLSGKSLEDFKVPTLFWNKVKPIKPPKKPLPKLEVDTKVLVWGDDAMDKHNRYFSHFDSDGKINCFADGTTSWTVVDSTDVIVWDHWELAND